MDALLLARPDNSARQHHEPPMETLLFRARQQNLTPRSDDPTSVLSAPGTYFFRGK